MAYGFNEDKSKATLSAGGDVVAFTGTATNVPTGSWTVNVLASDLAGQGITDLDDWAIVSVMTKGGISGQSYSAGTIRTNLDNNYPYAYFHTNGYLVIMLYNSTSGATDIDYKVVLMKIA